MPPTQVSNLNTPLCVFSGTASLTPVVPFVSRVLTAPFCEQNHKHIQGHITVDSLLCTAFHRVLGSVRVVPRGCSLSSVTEFKERTVKTPPSLAMRASSAVPMSSKMWHKAKIVEKDQEQDQEQQEAEDKKRRVPTPPMPRTTPRARLRKSPAISPSHGRSLTKLH